MFILPKSLKDISFPLTLENFPSAANPFLIADLYDCYEGDLLFVSPDDKTTIALQRSLQYLRPEMRIEIFPAWDCLPYDRISPRKDILGARINALTSLSTGLQSPAVKNVLLMTPPAFAQRVPAPSYLDLPTLQIKKQNVYKISSLIMELSKRGYHRTPNVHEVGEFSTRGGIFDIFPAGASFPYRLDFFGDELESLRTFDPLTQRSLEEMESLSIPFTSELILNGKNLELFRNRYREKFPDKLQGDLFYQNLSEGKPYPGMEHWIPLFYNKMSLITEYLKNPCIIFSNNVGQVLLRHFEYIQEHYQARQEMLGKETSPSFKFCPLPTSELYLTLSEFKEIERKHPTLWTTPFKAEPCEKAISPNARPLNIPKGNDTPINQLKKFLLSKKHESKAIHLACSSENSRQQLLSYLEDISLFKKKLDQWSNGLPSKGIFFHIFSLLQGLETSDFLVITEGEIFGEPLKEKPRKSRRSDLFIGEATSLQMGDYVVHEDHGVARYDGLDTLYVHGIPHDCLKLIYAEENKLFLPVENIDLISRYGSQESPPLLDRLGAAAWQARKAHVKKRLEDIAEHLMSVAAERHLTQGSVFRANPEQYEEFSNRFFYNETEDQQNAIDEVIADLECGKLMDRLICGDVGFGKTEVALRAAFIVASQGKQVALVAPTTLLARQHFAQFQKRFEGFGISVEHLSRFISPKKAEQIRKNLKTGEIQIVVGTHTLLSPSISFKELGLVIVDEEQHFGVKQKERLKTLDKNAHLLTLTATPIPRTLQLALTGVRDMSIIATPPVDRLAIRTFITPFDPLIIQEAIQRELQRGGQIFYVCPRIKDLDDVKEKLQRLDPALKIAVAHGQMPSHQLEKVMDDFSEGHYDLLISTNIIESGIDLPTVNTLFVHRADLFGLAQLYQLRGRVGRSKVRAYAYLTVPTETFLSPLALRRLEVMQTLDHLGASFQLASYDMDIRGTGNLLGTEQSGHIREVGIELYQQMLEEAVQKVKTHKPTTSTTSLDTAHWSPQLNLGIPVLIPDTYVSDLSVRLELYRRLGRFSTSEELEDFRGELVDRFGAYPPEVENLISIMHLKQLARLGGIDKIDIGDKGVILRFYQNKVDRPETLLSYIQGQQGLAKIRPDQTLFFARSWKTPEERFKGCEALLTELQKVLRGVSGLSSSS